MNKIDKIILIVYFSFGVIVGGILIGIIITTTNLPPSPIQSDAALGPIIILFFWVIEGICIIPKIVKRHRYQKKNLHRTSP
ncbi:MAG: hypothetical protein ACFFD7_16425 [Candidatus Thorarchaeota archaeon]